MGGMTDPVMKCSILQKLDWFTTFAGMGPINDLAKTIDITNKITLKATETTFAEAIGLNQTERAQLREWLRNREDWEVPGDTSKEGLTRLVFTKLKGGLTRITTFGDAWYEKAFDSYWICYPSNPDFVVVEVDLRPNSQAVGFDIKTPPA